MYNFTLFLGASKSYTQPTLFFPFSPFVKTYKYASFIGRDNTSTKKVGKAKEKEKTIGQRMVMQRLEICFGLVKMMVQFMFDFVDAIGFVVNQTNSALSGNGEYPISSVPYVGILP